MNIIPVQQTSFQPYSGYAPFKTDEDSFNPRVNAARETPNGQTGTDTPPNTSDSQEQESAGTSQYPQTEEGLTEAELRLLDELKKTDTEVRQHEMAHLAAAGGLALSGATFSYATGPDGQRYAVAGEVRIDTSPVPGDPEATIQKMQQVKRAALAPASPSSQDIKVASQATSTAAKATSELMELRFKEASESRENQAFGNMQNAADSYTRVNNLPEGDTNTFQLAV